MLTARLPRSLPTLPCSPPSAAGPVRAGAGGARLWVLVPLFSAAWASAFVVGKLGMRDLDPFTLLAARFGLASLVLGLWLAIRAGTTLPRVGPTKPLREAGLGSLLCLLNNALTLGLAFLAMQRLTPSMVTVLTSASPFVTLLLAAALARERLGSKVLLGVVIGFVGVLVIVGRRQLGSLDPLGLSLAVGSTISFALGTLVYRRAGQGLDPLRLVFWQCVAATVALAPLSHPAALLALPAQGWWAIAYLGLVVSIGAFLLWQYLIRLSGAGVAASYHLLNPAFGLLLGHAVFGDVLLGSDLPGAALIAGGLLMTTRSGR